MHGLAEKILSLFSVRSRGFDLKDFITSRIKDRN